MVGLDEEDDPSSAAQVSFEESAFAFFRPRTHCHDGEENAQSHRS